MNVTEWLEALNFSEDEFVSVCHKHCVTGEFKYSVLPPAAVPYYVESMSAEHDIWLGVNPVAGPPRSTGGRGKPEDVTRMSAVFADLDVKPGGCTDYDMAKAIVDELASVLGEYPTMTVHSGHGLQPYWAIENGRLTSGLGEFIRQDAEALLLRFGRLVRAVANTRGAKVDSVFDLARILRAPGTRNFKGDVPIETSAVAGGGAPMSLDTLAERLDEAGIFNMPDSSAEIGEDESDPASWGWADEACGYVMSMVRPWIEEPVDARHPWLLRCLVRLECARRNECVTTELYQGISEMLEKRFVNLLATQEPLRKPHRYEIRDLRNEAVRIASAKTPAGLASELGSHSHSDLIEDAVKAGKVRRLPTDRNKAKRGSAGQSDGKAATVTPLPTAQSDPPNYTMTDDGNGLRLVAQHAPVLRYVPERGDWAHWDGTRWRIHADDSPAVQAALAIARSLPTIAGDKAAVAWKKKSLSKQGILSMIRLAQSNARMQVSQHDLDTNGYELNTPNGVVDLRTGRLMPHDPIRWHTKITGAHYDPLGDTPEWDRFLSTTFQNDPAMISYIQRLAGYASIGDVFHHILPFLFGAGNNGKSVLLDIFSRVLGEYATSAPLNFLLAGRSDKHLAEIANLAGARFVICSEVNQDSKFDEAKIKSLTGGDLVSARFMRQDLFTFRPTHTLFLMGNHQPAVGAGGDSFWRRLRLVDFKHQVPESLRDEHLSDRLVEKEGPAILGWMVRGALDVLDNGLNDPPEVRAATEEYAESEDMMGQFIRECCAVGPAFVTATGEIFKEYRKWCDKNGSRAGDIRVFGRNLSSHGFPLVRTEKARLRSGIMLLETATGGDEMPTQEQWWQR